MQKVINLLLKSNQLSLRSSGVSMEPFFHENDILYFKKVPFNKIKVDDFIVIKQNRRLISHRVIYKTDKYLITKGDNNPRSDGKIYPKQVVGRVYQLKRNQQILNPENLYLIQSTLYFDEIVRIKNQFDRKKINYVFLKGLPLHLYYEGMHPKRIYADCDVLVEKKDFQKAEKTLTKYGYKKAKTELSKAHSKIKSREVENAYIKVVNHLAVMFDLHLEAVFMMTQLGSLDNLYPQKLIDQLTEDFLKTKRGKKINNEKFLILNTYYLILYLALHLFHHNFQGAFRYQLLDTIIRKEKPSNEAVKHLAETIKKYRLQNFVHPVFVLLKKYYKTPIPNSFLKEIKPKSLVNLNNLSLFDDEPRLRAGITRFKNLFFLSPEPWCKKIWVFFNPQVAYSIFWVLQKKVFSFLRALLPTGRSRF